jgi:hypothetical protein
MRRLLAVLAVLSVVLAATTYSFWRDRESERARADALQSRITALEAQRSAKLERTPAHPDIRVSSVPETQAPQSAIDAASDEADDDAAFDSEYTALRRRLLRDPKYYETWRASARLDFAARRDEMIRDLRIPPAKADEMVEYWIDRRLRSQQFDPKPEATEQEQLAQQELHAQQQREDDEKWRAIVGDELFGRMQVYEESRPSRYTANQLRSRLAGSRDALRDDQYEPLVGMLHLENSRLRQQQQEFVATLDTGDATAEAQRKNQQQLLEFHEETNRRIHSAASATLSSRQLAELDAVLRAQIEWQRANNLLSSMESLASEN